MIKAAFKNYFKNKRFILLIAAIMYTVIVIIAGVMFLAFSEMMLDPDSAVLAEFTRLFQEAFASHNLTDILTGGIGLLVDSLEYTLRESFEVSRGGLLFAILVSFGALIFAALAAGFLTSFLIKRKFKRKDTLKWYIALPFKLGLSFAFALIFAFAMYHFVLAIIPFLIAFLAFKSVQTIVEVRFIYFRDRKLFGEMLNHKTVLGYLAASGILFGLTALIPAIIWITKGLIFNPAIGFWIAIIVGMPLFIYYLETIGFAPLEYFMTEFNKNK